jgi:tetratricopeptide (TPR) repeat protein
MEGEDMRFRTCTLLSFLAIAAVASLLWPAVAVAQTEQQRNWCAGKDGASPNQRISGCTAVIQGGRESPKQLASTYKTRGTVYFYNRDYDRAIQDYTQAIKLDPQYSEAYDNRCWTNATVNKLQDALKDCSESLRLRPSFAPTLDTLGFVYLKLGQFDQAIATYTASLQIDPKSVYSLYGRGMAKLKTGDTVGGQADIAASKAIKDVSAEMAGYGVK